MARDVISIPFISFSKKGAYIKTDFNCNNVFFVVISDTVIVYNTINGFLSTNSDPLYLSLSKTVSLRVIFICKEDYRLMIYEHNI